MIFDYERNFKIHKSKSENSKRLINYRLLYSLPLTCIGLCLTSQTANAMFKNSLSFFKKLESSSTGTSGSPTRPLTSSPLTARGGSSLSLRGSRLSNQTSSNLSTKPKISPSTGTGSSSSFTKKLNFFHQ